MTIKEVMTELEEADYIGEDGDMVVNTEKKEDALVAFRTRLCGDVGHMEAEEIKLEDIGIGYVYLITEEEKKSGEFDSDWEWYVSYTKPNKNKVWVYHVN